MQKATYSNHQSIDFYDKRFPVDISYGSSGGPEYNTEVVMTTSGYEHRSNKWNTSRMRFNIINGIKNNIQMQNLIAFFRGCNGRYKAFRYKDWSDFRGINENIGIGDGIKQNFQLIKHYMLDGEVIEKRIIHKPVRNTVGIYLNGNTADSNQFDIDYNTGNIAFKTAPEKNVQISVSFEFDVLVRFETDYIPTTIESPGFFSFPDISLIEVKI